MALDTTDLYWAAGFLEGDGCFYVSTRARSVVVQANQIQSNPLERLLRLFGGSLIEYRGKGFSGTPLVWRWSATGRRAAGIMMTLMPLMSPRRQDKIGECISLWSGCPRTAEADEYADRFIAAPAIRRIAWAAGFLEAEGNFSPNRRGGIAVRAAQIQRDPLDRLQRNFGGSLILRNTKAGPVWHAQIGAMEAVELMMSAFVFMSPEKRSQIVECMDVWKSRGKKKANHAEFCTAGHLIDLVNSYTDASTGYRRCRKCVIDRMSALRASHRV